MREGRLVNTYPIETTRERDYCDVNHSGIVTRCPACGGRLDRACMDLFYCDDCGAEYFARQLRRPHTFHLTRVPR